MTLFIGIITTISFLAVRASAEISGKRYKDKDEGRLIMMSFFIMGSMNQQQQQPQLQEVYPRR